MHARPLPTLATLFAVLLLVAGPSRAQDAPAVVDTLPESFEVAILVPSLTGLSDQLANFESATNLGIGDLQDALGMFQRELGLINGMDHEGSMAVIIDGDADSDAGNGASAVMVLPVSDYPALVASLGGDPDQATTPVTLPGGTSGYCRSLGPFAVLGGEQVAVDAVASGDGLAHLTALVGPAGLETIAESQLSVVVNPALFGTDDLAQRLPEVASAMLTQADALLAVDLAPQPWMPQLQAWSRLSAQGATGMVLGLGFSADGMAFYESILLKEDSELAAAYKGPLQGDTSELLKKLPDRPIVLAAAGDPKAVSLAALLDQVGGVIGLAPDGALGELKPTLEEMMEPATGVGFALYAVPAGKIWTHWLNSATILKTDDPAAQRAAFKQFVTKLNGASLPLENGESVTLTAVYRENERQVDGVQIDTYTVRMAIPPSVQTDPLTQVIANLAGVGFTGQVIAGPQQVIVTTVDDSAMTTDLIQKAANPTGLGHQGSIAELREAQLPKQPTVQAYLNFTGIAESINPFLQMMGDAKPLAVPTDLPPVAMAKANHRHSPPTGVFKPTDTHRLLAVESIDIAP
ncbi:MAG: hypothetical protein AAGH88_08340, partial [Planctomycetota bacterium]